jgi:hypothetical protein
MAYTKSNGLGFRGHKLRPVANPAVYTPVIQRGHRNNGLIEVELEEEIEAQENGAIPKLKERNITLDFIEKARRFVEIITCLTSNLLTSLIENDLNENIVLNRLPPSLNSSHIIL